MGERTGSARRSSRWRARPRAAASWPGPARRCWPARPAASVARWSSPATPTPTTSAATSTRRAPASTRSACRGSTRDGYPLRPGDGKPVDNLGRLVNDARAAGRRRRPACSATPTGCRCRRPPAPRSASATAQTYGIEAHPQGAWYRCCGGHVRKLWDCCSHTRRADQRRRRAARLLLRGPQGVLRHLLPDEGPVLSEGRAE